MVGGKRVPEDGTGRVVLDTGGGAGLLLKEGAAVQYVVGASK